MQVLTKAFIVRPGGPIIRVPAGIPGIVSHPSVRHDNGKKLLADYVRVDLVDGRIFYTCRYNFTLADGQQAG